MSEQRPRSHVRAAIGLATVFFVMACTKGCDEGMVSQDEPESHETGRNSDPKGDNEASLVAREEWEAVALPLPPDRPQPHALTRVWNAAGAPCSAGVVIDPMYHPVKKGSAQRNSNPDSPPEKGTSVDTDSLFAVTACKGADKAAVYGSDLQQIWAQNIQPRTLEPRPVRGHQSRSESWCNGLSVFRLNIPEEKQNDLIEKSVRLAFDLPQDTTTSIFGWTFAGTPEGRADAPPLLWQRMLNWETSKEEAEQQWGLEGRAHFFASFKNQQLRPAETDLGEPVFWLREPNRSSLLGFVQGAASDLASQRFRGWSVLPLAGCTSALLDALYQLQLNR